MNDWASLPGRLVVVSGPSGSGKSTLVRRALERPGVQAELSISATTRAPRPGEVHGQHYYFETREAFEQARGRGAFLESAEVHGNLYGTPIEPVHAALASGRCVILEIDVQGGLMVRERVPAALLVFINVPSFAELEARLRTRATESEETITRRLVNARWELDQSARYDLQIMNHELDQAVDELVALLNQLGCGG
jgi:guanylate kinase